MRIIIHIIRKEFLQLFQDKKMLRVSIFAPIFQLIILGYAATFDVKDIPTVVVDQDRTATSRNLVERFVSTGYFVVVEQSDRVEDIDHLLDDGHASAAMVVPKGFEKGIGSGRSTTIQFIVDGAESSSASIALNYASIIISRFSQDVVLEQFQRRGAIKLPSRLMSEFRVWFNPELRSRNFMVPGVLGLLLMVMTMILTSLAIVKEKELGTLEQLVVTPIRPYQLIVGKLAPFLLIGMVDVLLVSLITTLLFGLPVKGGVGLLFALSLLFLMTTLGLGLFISTISRTQQQAMMTAIFFFMLPMVFFSGFVFAIENMPPIIQYISYLLPLRYFFVVVRGLFLKGVGLEVLWPQAVAMAGFGLAILTLSVLRFQKKIG